MMSALTQTKVLGMEYVQIIAGLFFFAAATGMIPLWPSKKKKPLFVVYHSDSCKYFKAYSLRDANEWMQATYDDAVMFCAKTGETLAIINRRNQGE